MTKEPPKVKDSAYYLGRVVGQRYSDKVRDDDLAGEEHKRCRNGR
jgi:hypothetical protein